MDAIAELFSTYSIESLILLLVLVGVALKFIIDLTTCFYDKGKKHFGKKTEQERKKDEILECLHSTQKDIIENKESIDKIEERVDLLTERVQENTRSYIIDKHHHFVFQIKAIDDFNLQSLERRYLYYKAAGGNSYIDGLMEEIRELPRVTVENIKQFYNIEEGV